MNPLVGVPALELSRSPAAHRIGVLARQSGLFLSHFEHRLDLELPEEWEPVGRPDLGTPQGWRGGVLPETKYGSFQHDRIIGSLHPAHRAKWTAHELCHGLVGFAWRPGCSRFFQALGARLSEALPVALYYFFDEAGLRRCPVHDGGGPLFGAFCVDCEVAATHGPVEDPAADRWMAEGRAFVERELNAVRRSLREGRMVPHHYQSLELGSDGLGYAAAHGPRLDSEEFSRFVELFCTENQGWFGTLEGLQERVLTLLEDLCGGRAAEPWSFDRWRWIAQDVGWRLLQIQADCGGPLRTAMDRAIDSLASAPTEAGVSRAIEAYREMALEWLMPSPHEVFAVGYPLPGGHGSSRTQLRAGLESVLPMTVQLLGSECDSRVAAFAVSDSATRVPLAYRFLETLKDGPLRELGIFEAALSHAGPSDLEAVTLRGRGGGPYRLRRGLKRLRFEYAVDLALDADWRASPQLPPRRESALHLVVFREPNGEVQVLEVTDETASALQDVETGELDIADDARDELLDWGVLVPKARP